MSAPIELTVTLARPAARVDEEPRDPVYALLRVAPQSEAAVRPLLDLCFVVDASGSMHQFQLSMEQREQWRQRAEARGEIQRQTADGRAGLVWSGQTLRELQQFVSTPMLSSLRGVWRTLEALEPSDRVAVLAFADHAGVIYEDPGNVSRDDRLNAARPALGRLGGGVDESGLGRGTRLAGALQSALERMAAGSTPALRRVMLISDGIIEDKEACHPLLGRALDQGLVISVIGVGDEFEEEFLMQAADLTRGNYYYAASAPEVEQAVQAELEEITRVVGREAVLRLVPDSGTVLRDVHPVSPTLGEFRTLWVENGCWRFRIGDLTAAHSTCFLAQLAPGAHPAGEIRIGAARVEAVGAASAEPFSAEVPIKLFYTDEAMLLQARDDEAEDLVRKLEIYREERRAAEAAAKGDAEASTRHLRAATRMLRGIGADDLADEMDAAADETETGTRNLGRTKKVKAGTRRLSAR